MLSDTMMLGGGRKAAYSIENSLLFRGGQYLSRTPSVPGNLKKWTYSGWVRLGGKQTHEMMSVLNGSSGIIRVTSSADGSRFLFYFAGSPTLTTAPVFRDCTGWVHFVLAVDTGLEDAVAEERVRLYANGVEIKAFASSNYPAQHATGPFNSVAAHYIGRNEMPTYIYSDGYQAETCFVDGAALPPTKFGEFDPLTGSWRPKRVQGVDFGPNGFYLGKPWNSTMSVDDLGTDYSGKGNHWTPTGFAATDVLKDSPTNVYATLNPLNKYSTLSTNNGNLTVASGQNGWRSISATLPMSSGKWYWEVNVGAWDVQDEGMIGIVGASSNNIAYDTNGFHIAADGYGYYDSNGQKVNSATFTNYGAAWGASNAVVGVAFDADSREIYFSVNGVWQNSSNPVARTNPAFTVTPGTYFPALASSRTIGATILNANFGQREWLHTPPSGFKALCTANLPTPVSAAAKQPGKYYACKTFTTTGGVGSFTVGWNPDPANGGAHTLFRIKRINDVSNWWWIDTVRGLDKSLSSDLTTAENTVTVISSVSANGTVNVSLASGYTYLVEAWRVAPEAGFDIVSYTGDGASARALAHNLGVTPSFTIFKSRSASRHWPVWHKVFASGEGCYMNLLEAKSGSGVFTALPNALAVNLSVDSNVNASGEQYVAYIWSEVPGFSAFGSYVGNGSLDGPYVGLGFAPAAVEYKRVDAPASWYAFDTARSPSNAVNNLLYLNNSEAANTSGPWIDITASGVKFRDNGGYSNSSGGKYIYAAWAAHPLGAKRVTPATAR